MRICVAGFGRVSCDTLCSEHKKRAESRRSGIRLYVSSCRECLVREYILLSYNSSNNGIGCESVVCYSVNNSLSNLLNSYNSCGVGSLSSLVRRAAREE